VDFEDVADLEELNPGHHSFPKPLECLAVPGVDALQRVLQA
jgi:hypothetical protein